jgi:transcriptional regulator with XRE-family HTH domain
MCKRQVGERVSQLRKERNLTRAEFGDLIGKSEQYVGRIERGTHNITGDVVDKICDVTGISADFIIRGMVDPLAAVALLSGLSHDQIQVTLEIAAGIIKFLSTADGNNALMQEALRRSHQRAPILQH